MDTIGLPERIIGHRIVGQFGEHYFSNLNPTTFVKFNPHEVFEAEFAPTLFLANKLYLIVGSDSGLLPQYIIAKGIPDGSRFIFIEPQEILHELQHEDVLPAHEHIIYADENSWLSAAEDFKIEDYFFIQGAHSYRAFCARNSSISVYAELGWFIDERLQQLYYETTIGTSTEPFLTQQILNLPSNQHPLILLNNAFKGKIAFVLGGGPSLDDVLPWLVKHRQSVVILAVSRVTKRLLQVGIEPDFFFSVDPFPVNFDVSKDIFSFSSKPIFVTNNHVYSELVGQWEGLSFYFGERVPWNSKLNVENFGSWGPTVTNAAIRAALHLGFERIFLAGVDFAYTLDGFTHAKGSIEHQAGARFNLTGAEVETYSGTMAPTGLDYAYARDMLEEQITSFGELIKAKPRVFNCSIMAAKVKGIDYQAIDSILFDSEPVQVEAIVKEALATYSAQSFFAEADKELRHALTQIKTIKRIAQDALDCNERMYNAQGLLIDYKDKLHLEKLEKQLSQKHKKFSMFVQLFGVRQFLKMIKPFNNEEASTEEVKSRLRIYYQSYIEGSNKLIELLQRAEQKIKAYAEEHKAKPNWDLLITNARQEEYFGRVRIWRKNHEVEKLPDFYQKIFAEFEQYFQNALKSCKSNHEKTIQQQANLSILNQKAQSLFEHKKIKQLNNLLLTLDKYHDKEKAIPYRHLVLGYIAELEQQIDSALQAYQQVIDSPQGPLEQALQRIIMIDLDKGAGDLAHQALECLVQFNPRYLAFYADSSRIRNNFLDAINAYINYLSFFPGDVFVQLKLTQLYMDQKIYDGAELMLNHILSQNPGNPNALQLQKQLREMKDNVS